MIKAKTDFPFSWATAPKLVAGWENEDLHFTLKADGGVAAAVFDGMGGAPDGDKASRMAAAVMFHNLNMMDFKSLPDEIAMHLQLFLQIADRHLKQMAEAGHLHRDAGTTAVVAVARHPESSESFECDVIVAWGGDSRAYLYKPDGQLVCLTIDNAKGMILTGLDMIKHRMAKTLQGFLSSVNDATQLNTLSKWRAYELRHIIDVGLFASEECPTPIYPASIVRVPLGSRIILCSDGLSDPLTDLEMKNILANARPSEGALALLQAARDRSEGEHFRCKDDDISVVEILVDRTSDIKG